MNSKTQTTSKTLRQIITENVGADIATDRYFADLGYNSESLDCVPTLAGRCWDGSSDPADVWEIGAGEYHVSSSTSEQYCDSLCDLSGFKPVGE